MTECQASFGLRARKKPQLAADPRLQPQKTRDDLKPRHPVSPARVLIHCTLISSIHRSKQFPSLIISHSLIALQRHHLWKPTSLTEAFQPLQPNFHATLAPRLQYRAHRVSLRSIIESFGYWQRVRPEWADGKITLVVDTIRERDP